MSDNTSDGQIQEGQGKEWVAFQQSVKRGGKLLGVSDDTSSDEEGEGQGKEWVPFQQRVKERGGGVKQKKAKKRGGGGERGQQHLIAAVMC